jgi:hypothetical protein
MHVERELREERLDFWIEHNFNVLFVGHYGAGKTTQILEAFKRNNLKFKYFSAATMDPWCDFIGVPKIVTDERGPYLDYILPRDLRDDTIEAIYMDEFNRSHKKVRNAVMELLQFKSINGRPFSKLRIIWAAINPEDEGEYQVEPLDPAQKDRFQVRVGVPFKPSLDYFKSKFPESQAKAAVEWWDALDEELQMKVSPRRLEYALQMYNIPGGNLKDVLDPDTNPSKLKGMLKTGPVSDWLRQLFQNNDPEAAKRFLGVENNYASAVKYICDEPPDDVDKEKWMTFFLPSLTTEKITVLLASNEDAWKFIVGNCDKIPIFRRVIQDVLNTKTNKNLLNKLKNEMRTNPVMAASFNTQAQAEKPYFSKRAASIPWPIRLADWMKQPMATTPQRNKIFEEISDWLPATLTQTESVDTLEMFGLLADRSHSSTVKEWPHFIGMVNHCIDQLNKATGLSWREILTNYGSKLSPLLSKLRTAELDKKMLCPPKRILTP